MRYLTNQLGWSSDALSINHWIDSQGNGLDSKFSFGANHNWQYPSGTTRLFASEELCIEQAKAWLKRDEFQSLVSGANEWSEFLSRLLATEITNFQAVEDTKPLRIQKGDFVLRVGYACASKLPDKWSRNFIEDLPEKELIALLSCEPDLIRFYLHFLQEQSQRQPVYWDAGL